MSDLLVKAIKMAQKRGQSVAIVTGLAENIQGDTCDVVRDGLPTLFDVRLMAIDQAQNSFIKIVPKDKSPVAVILVDGSNTEGIIVSTSEIDSLEVKIEQLTFKLDSNGMTSNLGAGKLKIENQAEGLKEILSEIVTQLQSITIPLAPSGTGVPVNLPQIAAITPRINLLFQ